MRIHIVTDSTCDLPAEVSARLGITISISPKEKTPSSMALT